jgi:hypothetical protein
VFIRGDKVDNFFCNIFIHYVSRIFIKEFWVYEWYCELIAFWALDEDNCFPSGKMRVSILWQWFDERGEFTPSIAEDLRCLLMGHWKWYSLIRYLQGVSHEWYCLFASGLCFKFIFLNVSSLMYKDPEVGCNNPDKMRMRVVFQIHWHRKLQFSPCSIFKVKPWSISFEESEIWNLDPLFPM